MYIVSTTWLSFLLLPKRQSFLQVKPIEGSPGKLLGLSAGEVWDGANKESLFFGFFLGWFGMFCMFGMFFGYFSPWMVWDVWMDVLFLFS